MNLKNKTILITGTSSGIGKALALKLLAYECNLVLISRRQDLINEYIGKFPNIKSNVLIQKCDVGNKKEVSEAYENIKRKFRNVDLVILNAGVSHRIKPGKYDSKLAEEIFGTNVLGIIYWVEQILPDFLERRSGVVAGVSSLADNRGYSGSGFYSASKAAVSNYLEGLRIELAPYNISVVTIKPGFVNTPMNDKNEFWMPWLMNPGRAAEIIIRGLEKKKQIIQFPLPLVLLTKLIGIFPSSLYYHLAKRFSPR